MEDARKGNGIVCCDDDDDDDADDFGTTLEVGREGVVASNDVSPKTSYISNVVGLDSMHSIFLLSLLLLLLLVDCCC